MSPLYILFLVLAAVTMLLLMVLKFRLNAFIALLITSILVAIMAGMPLTSITSSIQEGMGSTLGFIATVVGLGAIFGQMLETSGGAKALSTYLLKKFGTKRASWALMLTGFIVGIPIFLDIGFIILVPIVYSLTRSTGKSILYYAIPLLAGLAVAHSMVPPTPGPTAVAQILEVDLGWVVLFGLMTGLPTAIIAGPIFGQFIAKKIHVNVPEILIEEDAIRKTDEKNLPSFGLVAFLVALPLILIIASTFLNLSIEKKIIEKSLFTDLIVFLGHPFTALIIATLLSILTCLRRNFTASELLNLSTKALGPAGIIILVTGAGGVLKQILIDSGIGKILAESVAGNSVPLLVLAWLIAALVRIAQGSATVAMITSASIISPMVKIFALSQPQTALVVVSIAAGATIMSHVNDSGFWIVSRYLGMDEKQTLKSWTVMETIVAIAGLAFTMIISLFF
ncbi:MAG TPA: gluconate:H+ symporter [Bacteroidales bacterium]|nr:gluconate transporter [Bacteroidales bacterium]HQG37436.1 gluconate:H+ symporter [Bacteroidales bacterium]HQG52351.1 gluconate:H+ symporter [Bacteroidales bacterium]